MKRPTREDHLSPKTSSAQLTIDYHTIPNCHIATWVKLHTNKEASNFQPRATHKNKQSSLLTESRKLPHQEQGSLKLSPNIVVNLISNSLTFHHYQKYNSYNFLLDKIIHPQTLNYNAFQQIDLFEMVVERAKDCCIMAIGGVKSGISQLCEEADGKEGAFYLLISKLIDRIAAIKAQSNRSKGKQNDIECLSLKLKFLVIFDDRLYDLSNPKNSVKLRQHRGRTVITGCQQYQPSGVYDFFRKMRQVTAQKKLIYPESIFFIDGQLSSEPQTKSLSQPQEENRHFALIQWQKSIQKRHSGKKDPNNNQSLLALNKCIYQLYKYSCHSTQSMARDDTSKLWSIFRNSSITKLLKNYLVQERRVIVVGCISVEQQQEEEEEENFQTLMLCKNVGRIKLNRQGFGDLEVQHQHEQKQQIMNSFKTIDREMDASRSVIISEKGQDFINLQRVKLQLRKILDEHQLSKQKEHQENSVQLVKLEKKKKKDLLKIRYKQQQLKVQEQLCALSRLRTPEPQPEVKKSSSNIRNQSLCEQQLAKLKQEEIQRLNQINKIHSRVLEDYKHNRNNLDFRRNLLEMEIRQNERESVEFVQHKKNIINLLKQEVKEVKREQCRQRTTSTNPNYKLRLRRNKPKQQPFISGPYTSETTDNAFLEDSRHTLENPEGSRSADKIENIKPLNEGTLKHISRENYLFEKRRVELKRKILQNKQQMNKYYEQVAQNFQQYPRRKMKTQQ